MKRWVWIGQILLVSILAAGCYSKDQPTQIQKKHSVELDAPTIEQEGIRNPAAPQLATGSQQSSAFEQEEKPAKRESQKTEISIKSQVAAPKVHSQSELIADLVTEEEIANKYKQKLVAMQNYYSGELQLMYKNAINDLKETKESKSTILGKYAKRGRAIEEESQAKVNQVLALMKEELLSRKLPTDKVNIFRNTYYTELGKAKSKAMAEIKKELGL